MSNIYSVSLCAALITACTIATAPSYISNRALGAVSTDTPEENRINSPIFDNSDTHAHPLITTWSIVPDGTTLQGSRISTTPFGTSSLISALDAAHEVTNPVADLTTRPWFSGISEGLNLINRRSGVQYLYESADDGVDANLFIAFGDSSDVNPGVLGTRGDLRIGGLDNVSFGGISSSSPAGLFHPDVYFNVAALTTIEQLRFVITHEALHALGFNHSTVNGSRTNSSVTGAGGTFTGPQFDDICALHSKYGDFYEKVPTSTPVLDSNGNQFLNEDGNLVYKFDLNRNDIISNATDLGIVSGNQPVIIGNDAGNDVLVPIDEFDFISISNVDDKDFLKFTVTEAGDYILHLDPRGPTYTNYNTDWTPTIIAENTATIAADALNDLEFKLYNASGSLLKTISSTGLGSSEISVESLSIGTYYIEVSGTTEDPRIVTFSSQMAGPQMYAFSVISTTNPPVANDLSFFTASNASVEITLSGSDVEGDPLSYNISSNPPNGSISGTPPNITYTPNPNFIGTDTFTYTVTADNITSEPATVTVEVAETFILAGYDFDNGSGTPTTAVTVTDTNTNASEFRVGNGLAITYTENGNALNEIVDATGNPLGTDTPISFGGIRNNLGFTRGANLNEAINDNDYLGFTVSPNNGISLDLTSFSFRAWANNLTESANQWSLYTSLDGFSTPVDSGTTATTGQWINHQVNLLDPDFQDLTSPVEFRLYIFNGRNNSQSLTMFDKFAVYGIVDNGNTPDSGYDIFINGNPTITETDFNADPDGDGIPNGVEYVLNTDPSTVNGDGSTRLPISFEESGNDLVFTFMRNASSIADTNQLFQYGNNFTSWTGLNLTGTIPSNITITPATNNMEEIEITLPNSSSEQKLFWRLKVDQQ